MTGEKREKRVVDGGNSADKGENIYIERGNTSYRLLRWGTNRQRSFGRTRILARSIRIISMAEEPFIMQRLVHHSSH